MKRIVLATLLMVAFASLVVTAAIPESRDDRVLCHEMECGTRRIIEMPEIEGYVTLKADLHIHTVYSDGRAAPQGRVREAWADGLDVIAVTDHVGYRANKGVDVKDYNLAPEIAAKYAARYGMLVIKGVEITRDKPFGHICALFLEDCNVFCEDRHVKGEDGKPLRDENGKPIPNRATELSDFEAAERQGAFMHWNHPGFADGKCTLYDFHRQMLEQGRIHAVEIFNKREWYPKVLGWHEQYGVPMTANADLHNLTSFEYGAATRPMNLIFARERTLESLREAMFAGRMVALFNNMVVGPREWVEPLVRKSLEVRVLDEKKGQLEISNPTDLRFDLIVEGGRAPVRISPHRAVLLRLKQGETVRFDNVYIGEKNLEMALW